MYHQYFGLKETPFSIAVDPRYLFMSARHRDALAHLLYGVGAGGGFILLTGEVGTGKTTVIRCLLERLPENTDLAIILNPALDSVELLATVCDELGIHYNTGEASLKVYTDLLHTFLLNNYAENRKTVLLIDEAQHLQFEVLEQVRLLTNLETNTQKLLQIVLVGQPELRTLLNKPELRQLAQRITARYQLKPLNLPETQDYIRHRLHIAGLPNSQQLFPDRVVKLLHNVSRGVPRLINILCDRSLLGTYAKNNAAVDRQTLKQAIIEVMGEKEESVTFLLREPSRYFVLGIVIFCVVLSSIGTSYYIQFNSENSQTGSSIPQQYSAVLEEQRAASDAAQYAPKTHRLKMDEQSASMLFSKPETAYDELSTALNLKTIDCTNTPSSVYHCVKEFATSWQDLIEFNRPAIIKLLTPAKLIRYATVISINGSHATIVSEGNFQAVPLKDLGEMWTGDFTFVWKPPTHYSGRISKGDSGPMVNWLADQFATIDGQKNKLTDFFFNESLSRRVKIFQSDNGLDIDGVVGLKTLLAVNQRIGKALTLSDPLMEKSSGIKKRAGGES